MEWQLHEAGEGGVDGTVLAADVASLPFPSAEALLSAAHAQKSSAATALANESLSALATPRSTSHSTMNALDVAITPRVGAATPQSASPPRGTAPSDPSPPTVHTAVTEGQSEPPLDTSEAAVPGWPQPVADAASAQRQVAELPGNIAAARWLNLMLTRAAPALYAQHLEGLTAGVMQGAGEPRAPVSVCLRPRAALCGLYVLLTEPTRDFWVGGVLCAEPSSPAHAAGRSRHPGRTQTGHQRVSQTRRRAAPGQQRRHQRRAVQRSLTCRRVPRAVPGQRAGRLGGCGLELRGRRPAAARKDPAAAAGAVQGACGQWWACP